MGTRTAVIYGPTITAISQSESYMSCIVSIFSMASHTWKELQTPSSVEVAIVCLDSGKNIQRPQQDISTFTDQRTLLLFIHSLNNRSLSLLFIMTNKSPSRVAAPDDEDEITFAPPLPTEEAEDPTSDTNIHNRPGLPHQTLDVATAQEVTRQAMTAPASQHLPPSIGQGTQGTTESWELINFDGTDNAPRPDEENYWRGLQVLVCFWKRRRRVRSSNERPLNNSKFNAACKRFRARISRKSSPASQTPGNQAQQTQRPPVARRGANNVVPAEANKTRSSRTTHEALPVQEVDTLLEKHRSKLSAGHQGQLRGLLQRISWIQKYNLTVKLTRHRTPQSQQPCNTSEANTQVRRDEA